jgi:hypothetical protein
MDRAIENWLTMKAIKMMKIIYPKHSIPRLICIWGLMLISILTYAQDAGHEEELLSSPALHTGSLDDGQATVPLEKVEWILAISGLSLGMYRIYKVSTRDGR